MCLKLKNKTPLTTTYVNPKWRPFCNQIHVVRCNIPIMFMLGTTNDNKYIKIKLISGGSETLVSISKILSTSWPLFCKFLSCFCILQKLEMWIKCQNINVNKMSNEWVKEAQSYFLNFFFFIKLFEIFPITR